MEVHEYTGLIEFGHYELGIIGNRLEINLYAVLFISFYAAFS